MVNRLKIKYIFEMKRNPEKDIKNGIYTIANDVFFGSFYEYILPEIIQKSPKDHNHEDVKIAIDFFMNNLNDHIKDEPLLFQKLIMYYKDKIRKEIEKVI